MRSKTIIGDEIYRIRRGLGWTQGELASKVGVSRAAISQFELGDTMPSAETQAKLSDALGEHLVTAWHESEEPLSNRYGLINFIPASSYDYLTYLAQKRDAESESEPIPQYSDRTPIIPIILSPDIDHDFGYVVEIKNNSMAPRYPQGARYYMIEIDLSSDENIRFMSGVYMFVLDEREPFIRRVISTAAGLLTLQADANGEKMDFEIQDLKQRVSAGTCLIFKLGQGVYMPAE